MTLLGIDVGTTHCKAGVFNLNGTLLHTTSRPTPTRTAADNSHYYDPNELWETVAACIRNVSQSEKQGAIAALGVTSMAETGVLIDQRTGAPRSDMIPWFEMSSAKQAEWMRQQTDPAERFGSTGIRGNFKCSLAKMLWLRERGTPFESGVWLSAADYIMYRLTGAMATDHSLAGRTYAFDICQRRWDEAWIAQCGFPLNVFPTAQPADTIVGKVNADGLGIPKWIPAFIAGHDHVCAAFAVGAVQPDIVMDSMGTAEALVGVLDALPSAQQMRESALVYGCHVAPDQYYWMGGSSASGGSVEWLRTVLGDDVLTYDEISVLLDDVKRIPSGIIYFPYLSGRGFSQRETSMKAAFIGLEAGHGKGDLLMAALEGTAYEMEAIRRAAEKVTNHPIKTIVAVGGGIRNRHWMRVKTDISGSEYRLFPMAEATLLGAALIAGIGAGLYHDVEQALQVSNQQTAAILQPDAEQHQRYQQLFEHEYLRLQQLLEG